MTNSSPERIPLEVPHEPNVERGREAQPGSECSVGSLT
jgi:hypothetical protein